MNFYQYPFFFMYCVVPTSSNPIPQNQIPVFTPQPAIKCQLPNTFTHLIETQKELEIFLNKLKNFASIKSNIAYMELNAKVDYEYLPKLEQFKEIYSGGLNRYKETYKDQEKKINWGKDDVLILLWILDKYCKLYKKLPNQLVDDDWMYISKMVPFRTGKDCMFKWLSLKKNRLEAYPWTKDEQNFLFKLIEEHNMKDWMLIAKKLFEEHPRVFRSPKQCRQHWAMHINSMHQRCKKLWLKQQDLALLQYYERQGRRWKHISSFLPGRSQNAIKNRFNLLMQKYYGEVDEQISQLEKVEKIKQKVMNSEYLEKKISKEQKEQNKQNENPEIKELVSENH